MPISGLQSLLAGRNHEPLSDAEILRVTNTLIGLDREVSFKYVADECTRCRQFESEGDMICEIVFGPDVFPGKSVVDPNSSLSMRAAIAHEISHFHRWRDKTELTDVALLHVDEALTSLDAVQRFHSELNDNEIRQLVADAMQRLQLHAAGLSKTHELFSNISRNS